MNELQRAAGIVPNRDERVQKRATAHLVNETKFNGLKVDAEAALTGRIMERAVDLDNYRKSLSGGDPVLDGILARIEVGFVDKAMRIQKSFGSDWPLL